MLSDTTAFEKIEAMDGRINIIQGGTSSSKTYSILMLLIDLSFEVDHKTITVMSDTFPALRRGAMKDWRDILRQSLRDRYFEERITEHTWVNLCTGTRVEFLACDDMGALGARRDYLFVNEANRITYETFGQLEIRTMERIWLDYNPASRFWVMSEIMEKRTDWQFIKLTYRDNEALPDTILQALLQRRGDGTSNWWRVYGEGEVGSLEGNVYEGWTPVESVPDGYVLKRYGVDFGWNDPTAITAIYENDAGEICIDEVLYRSKMPTPELIEFCKGLQPELMVCDSARPEIIAEMVSNGIRAIGCDKGPVGKQNSVIYGIDLVKRRKVFYTAGSKNLEREFLTYAWRKKKSTGETIDEPEDANNHLLDSVRYSLMDMERKPIEYGGVR